MKAWLRHIAKTLLIRLLQFSRGNFHQFNSLSQQAQLPLRMHYQELGRSPAAALPDLSDVGFRVYSQFEEDGQLLFILSVIGFKTRIAVEICAADSLECMTTNLILNHGFKGFLFDGDARNVARGRRFFSVCRDTLLREPQFTQAWVTAENVNLLLSDAGVKGEIDLLSLDIDGNDYWVWQAIEVISPRLCVIETHNPVPSDLSLTIPYDPQFTAMDKPYPEDNFRGMSLRAAVGLARRKGYRLIGGHQHGFNVYFLRNDILAERFPEVSIESVHSNPYTMACQRDLWPLIRDFPWQTVDA
jgi:hypothetical protein